jgi:hypothetical protein
MSDLSHAFYERFEGLNRAYGQYKEKTRKGATKIQGHARTIREAPTPDIWEKHLDGEIGIGIVPIMDDSNCVFGAIDIDDYGLNIEKLESDLISLELPLILCRTKSGGAHLYLFLEEPASCDLVRKKLMEWAVVLGHSGVEVFPKQTRLANEHDIGNWINMPYYNASKTNRYAIVGGKKLSAEQFIDFAKKIEVGVDELKKFEVAQDSSLGDLLFEAPPCLQTLARRGFGEGNRNNALFNIAVYLRNRYGEDDWADKLDKYNQEFMEKPLGHKEVAQITRSVNRKSYGYKCEDHPIAQVCNKQICLSRKFGVGTGDNDPGVVFGSLVKLETDPPVWIWDVDGARIELSTPELKDQNRFHTRCIDVLNKWPLPIKPKDWSELIRGKLSNCEIVEVPDDAKPEGRINYWVDKYLHDQPKARNRKELLLDKPYIDNGKIYFSSAKLQQFLEQNRIRIKERDLWVYLRKREADKKFFNIDGRGINTWVLPVPQEQEEAFVTASIEDEEEM